MPRRINHRFLLFFAVIFIFLPSHSQLQAEEQAVVEQLNAAQHQQQLDLIETYQWTNSLPRDLVDLQADIGKLTDIKKLDGQLPDIERKIEELAWKETSLKSDPNLTFHAINFFEAELGRIRDRIRRIDIPLQDNIATLEAWHKKWRETEKKLQTTTERLSTEFESGEMFPEIQVLSDNIATGKELIQFHLKANLLAGQEIGQAQTRIYEMTRTAAVLMTEMNATRTQQTSPSMLSAEFYRAISGKNFSQAQQSFQLFVNTQLNQLKQHAGLVAAGLLIVAFLTLLIYLSKSLVKPSMIWSDFAGRPVVTAVFVFSLIFSLVKSFSSSLQFPPDWDMLMYLPLLVSAGILSEYLFKAKWQASIVKNLLIYFGLTIIITLINLPSVLLYLIVFYLSVSLFIFYLIQLIRHRSAFTGKWKLLSVLFWFIFPLVIIIAGIGGYDQLAVVLFGRILAFISITLTIRLMLLLLSGFLELLLNNSPWKLIRDNAATIVRQVTPLLALLHFILWMIAVLVIVWVYPTNNAAFEALSSFRIEFFSFSITPEGILAIILIAYITLLVSRALRAFLLQQLLPYHGVEKGVQISIARLVHYAILTVGFLILLKAMGFGMSQITILGGALGVGIGFGLQAIVNNFVSGLILLFERPIKVGDMIDVGNQVGEVKELGLSATTVQTFDNAEVVIPNSQLISTNVTNWTLAEKKIRVKIPVGVAYGSDVSEVLRILLACADANPMVLSTPKPAALFLAFGASSLDFELRVWIADFNDKLIVLSELNQDIEAEFDAAGIEIPFPQTDLHLRSIDQDAADKLHRIKTQSEKEPVPSTDGEKKEKEHANNHSDR